ncbi:MAG: VWA domain-containing protein [Thermoanaerobaculaceae bacterium]|nr:VWA domain-containing protein [Thermoanaerobaculaceae bacterium]MDI9620699.1 VWA domain-containing protein [Acidobacteriota bacterium]NLH10659.1 VWA domain-containing protein [Holophagae bacterium]HPW55810.1 VWA domain-containing protein [Thermoanaerobaculaceae bacterium]
MTTLLCAMLFAVGQPVALRAEVQTLGKGPQAMIVGVAVQVAPEDRARVGERAQVKVVLLRTGRIVDAQASIVTLAADGSALLLREWPAGEGEVRVFLEALEGGASGSWSSTVDVVRVDTPYEPGADAPVEAVALAALPAAEGAVRFLPPPRSGGIGALQLEVEAPPQTERVAFACDGEPLGERQRRPWTVSVNLGAIARRTVITAQAFARDGRLVGEDALVLNAPPQQIAVELMVGAPEGSTTLVTVAVRSDQQTESITLKLDDRAVARWVTCPCVVRLPSAEVASAKVVSAEVLGPHSTRGEAVRVVGLQGFQTELQVEVVELPVNVFDRAGVPVGYLDRDAFTVREDGQEVAIEAFGSTVDLPLNLGILVDTSGSMRESFAAVRHAVTGFASRLLRPQDSYFVMTFSFEPQVQLGWNADKSAIAPVLARLVPEGGTALNDAVVRGLELFRGRRGRSALVVLTDGDDTSSRTAREVTLRYVKTARTPVFPIGFQLSKLDFLLRQRLRDLAEVSGGELFLAPRSGDLEAVYARIDAQLRSQYLLTYRSPSSKSRDQFRAVSVEVKGEGLVARTFAGYYPAR